jgi:hypothetical protein
MSESIISWGWPKISARAGSTDLPRAQGLGRLGDRHVAPHHGLRRVGELAAGNVQMSFQV